MYVKEIEKQLIILNGDIKMNNNQNKNYPINLIGISGRIGSG